MGVPPMPLGRGPGSNSRLRAAQGKATWHTAARESGIGAPWDRGPPSPHPASPVTWTVAAEGWAFVGGTRQSQKAELVQIRHLGTESTEKHGEPRDVR